MKIKTISYKRLFNLGNYNNEEISFSAELEDETPEDAHIYSEKVNQAKQMLEALSGKYVYGSEYTNSPYLSNSIPAFENEISKTKSQIKINTQKLELESDNQNLKNEITKLDVLLATQETELQKRKDEFWKFKNQIKRLKDEYGKTN